MEYTNLLHVAEENTFDVIECERQLFDIDHSEAGRWLADHWHLPKEFGEVAAGHHRESERNQFGMVELIRVGCSLSDSLGFEVVKAQHCWTLDEIHSQLPPPAREHVTLDKEDLKARTGGKIVALLRGPLN